MIQIIGKNDSIAHKIKIFFNLSDHETMIQLQKLSKAESIELADLITKEYSE